MNKKCKDCGILKSRDNFYGVQGECKLCTQKRVHINYFKNREHYIKYEKKREKNEERKSKKYLYYKNYKLKNKLKILARAKVNKALKSGILLKSNCSVCYNTKTEAHHKDYNKPLEIIWLCRKHHMEIEGKKSYY